MIYFKTKRYNCVPRVLEFKDKADLLEYFEFLYQKRLPSIATISDICNAFENDFQIFRRISAKELKKTVDKQQSKLYNETKINKEKYLKMNNEYELEQQFDELLDECWETIIICGYEYNPSIALKRVDPVAYRQAFLNYCNNVESEENE